MAWILEEVPIEIWFAALALAPFPIAVELAQVAAAFRPTATAPLAIPRPQPYVTAADGCESGFAAFGRPAAA
jgi:hypothetical protein